MREMVSRKRPLGSLRWDREMKALDVCPDARFGDVQDEPCEMGAWWPEMRLRLFEKAAMVVKKIYPPERAGRIALGPRTD
jgi:hypothetical protein